MDIEDLNIVVLSSYQVMPVGVGMVIVLVVINVQGRWKNAFVVLKNKDTRSDLPENASRNVLVRMGNQQQVKIVNTQGNTNAQHAMIFIIRKMALIQTRVKRKLFACQIVVSVFTRS